MRSPNRLSLLLALAVLAVAAGLLAAPQPRKVAARKASSSAICDHTTALTLIGIDTISGRMLFAVPPLTPDGKSWVVELDADGRGARAWPDPPKGLFSGSVGPGPVVAALPCGESCIQPVQWDAGSWKPLGEPLTTPTASTLTPTWDHSGAPWLILRGASGTDGLAQIWAYRLQGREWRSRGSMGVTAIGQPQALPAPQRKDGILCGTGLFSASGRPETWVTGLPSLPAERRGQLIALTGTSVAYISGDGVVYLSDDSGRKWRRSTWTPWGTSGDGVVGSWRQGRDYWVDLPYGDHRGSLRLVWFDRRRPSEETILLTRLLRNGDWFRSTEAPSEIRTRSGDIMPVSQVLVPSGDTWVLLSGCAATANGSGLVLRVYDGTTLTAPKLVPFSLP